MSKKITITTGNNEKEDIAIASIRSLKIVNNDKASGERPAFQTKLIVAGVKDPVYVTEAIKDLRSNDMPLVYLGGGVYAPRAHIARLEPLSVKDRQNFAEEKGTKVDHFQTRVVLSGKLGTFWVVKSIAELNEKGDRFVPIGEGVHVHVQNIRKITELSDAERTRISERYNTDASAFRCQILVQGEDKPKLAKLSVAELRAAGLDLVEVGQGEFAVRQNVKHFGPFGPEDQERLASLRDGMDAEKFASKLTMAWGLSPILSTKPIDTLRASLKGVNLGYDRHVPVENIVAEKVVAFTKDEKSSLSDAGYAVDRAWKSSVGLVNGLLLSPATPDQVKQRCEKAKAHYGTTAPAPIAPELALG